MPSLGARCLPGKKRFHDDRDGPASVDLCRRSRERLALRDPYLGRRRGRLGGELLVGAGGAGLGGRHGRDPGGADRGGALDKARFRLAATIIGVTASIVIVALFSQTRDLMLAAFALWVGLCVCAAGLPDGNHAYAAVLSGYTVALIGIQQLDAPEHVFESGMARGAAIAVGVAAIAVVNDLLAAPESFPQLASRLAALHQRVRDYARPAHLDTDVATAAELLRDIAALHPEIASLATESASGSIRSAAARSTAIALVAAVHAARALRAVAAATNPAMGDIIAATRSPALAFASREFLRRLSEVREGLAALNAGHRIRRVWRMPLYRSRPIAVSAGLRAAAYLALAFVFFVLAGWPSTEMSLSLVALVIGLGAVSPNPQVFTVAAFIAAPIALRDRRNRGGDKPESHGRVARSAEPDLHCRHSVPR